MSTRHRGLVVAAVQVAIVCSLAGKFYVDRAVMPRIWVRTFGYDPQALIRGRYVRLALAVAPGTARPHDPVRLQVVNGRLEAAPDARGNVSLLPPVNQGASAAIGPVAFFIPDGVPDPTFRKTDEELWAEVTVPRRGLPRPIRLGVKRAGVIEPIAY